MQRRLLPAELKRSRQIWLLETLILEGAARPPDAPVFSPRAVNQLPALSYEIVDSVTAPSNLHHEKRGTLGSTGLETPSVENAPGRIIPRFGPIGTGRIRHCSSRKVLQVFIPGTSFPVQPIPRSPSKIPPLEAMLDEACDSPRAMDATRKSSLFGPLDTFSFPATCQSRYAESLDEHQSSISFLSGHCMPSPVSLVDIRTRWISPPYETLSAGATTWHQVYPPPSNLPSGTPRPTAPLFRPVSRVIPAETSPPDEFLPEGFPSFNCVRSHLERLDGTATMKTDVWDQLLILSQSFHFSKTILTIVECLVDYGITRGPPINSYISDFCGFILERVSIQRGRSGNRSLLNPCENDFRAAFISIFKQSWSSPSPPGSPSFKLLIRVASFYGHLYLRSILNEKDFKVCIKYLSGLSPLPREGLHALLTGNLNIEG